MLLLALACRAPEPAVVTGDTVVRFEPGPGPLALGDVPFPSELYRDDAGRIALGPLPNPRDGEPVFDALRDLLAGRTGFCATCAVRFGLRGAPDLADLAERAEELSADPLATDAVVVVDLDTGDRLPLDLAWDADLGVLAARPTRGHLLRSGHRHAAVVTTTLLGEDGLAVGADPAFVGVRDVVDGADPRALDLLGPTVDDLDSLGIARDTISGLAAFVPEDPTVDLRAVHQVVEARPPVRPVVDAVWTGAALDEILGVPAEDRPGMDVPPAEGTEGQYAIRHATTRVAVAGRFPAPRFVSGEGTEVGLLQRGPDGAPIAPEDDLVPFVLIVPEGADPTRLPLVVSQHGFNNSRAAAFALADTAGRAGFAVLGIDAYQHGARAASAKDELHALRGDVAGPDGLAETATLDVSGRVFGMFGVPAELMVFPGYPLGAFTQFAADALSAAKVARDGDWSEVAAADPALEGLAFDRDRLAYIGNSMGSVVGAQVVAAQALAAEGGAVGSGGSAGSPDTRLGAAVLDVMPGAIVDTLCESGEFRSLSEDLLLPIFGVEGPFDEVERSMALDPTVDLFRWAMEPVDPLALAPWLAADGGPDLLVHLAGHDEIAAPGPSEAVVAAAGIPGVGTFGFAPVAPASLPASVVAVRYDGAGHGMLEILTQDARYAEPLVPPLVLRAEPEPIVNPIGEVHDQIERFLTTWGEQGRAVVP